MKKQIAFIYLQLCLASLAFGQKELLQSGPMLGYSEMKEVLLWVQTKSPAMVQFAYWETGATSRKTLTDSKTTAKEEGYTARLIADQVEPGKQYDYELLINNQPVKLPYPTRFQTQTLWQFRTDPPDFSLAVGSCFYVNEPEYDRPGTPYGGEYQIMTAIYNRHPDAMLWLGDNVYFREPDWYTRTGMIHRYTHTRSLPELQPLLASTHHYAIWDDHDFGPNDSDRGFIQKDETLDVFKLFWGNLNYGLPGKKGVTGYFQFEDVDFFLLDNRYFRTPNNRITEKRTLLGSDQIEWLIDALAFSKAPFKVIAVGGQFLNTVKAYETYANLAPEERSYILDRIEEEGITGVVFLSGDRHHTELSAYTNAAGHTVYDLTVSPLTSGVGNPEKEVNDLRVPGTLLVKRNFGLLEFSGPLNERKMTIRIINSAGEEQWSREIRPK